MTLQHGPLENLDMPAMKMVFKAADPKLLEGLKEGRQSEVHRREGQWCHHGDGNPTGSLMA